MFKRKFVVRCLYGYIKCLNFKDEDKKYLAYTNSIKRAYKWNSELEAYLFINKSYPDILSKKYIDIIDITKITNRIKILFGFL